MVSGVLGWWWVGLCRSSGDLSGGVVVFWFCEIFFFELKR